MNDPLIIIPTYLSDEKHCQILENCLSSLRSTTDTEILVVDDASPLGSEFWDREAANTIIEKPGDIQVKFKTENKGFANTVNIGLEQALKEKRDAILVNSDIIFNHSDWLEQMQNTNAGIIGALLVYPNTIIQHAGIFFSSITKTFDHRFKGAPQDLPVAHKECICPVTAALQYIRHEVLEDIGIYDGEFKLAHEDVDFALRAIFNGHTSLYNPKVKAIHYESIFRSIKSKKMRAWENESLGLLMKKYANKNFFGFVPSMFEPEIRA